MGPYYLWNHFICGHFIWGHFLFDYICCRKEKTRGRDSFQDFQEKTNDAWDDGDDDVLMMSSHNHLHGSVSFNSRLAKPDLTPLGRTSGAAPKSGLNNFAARDTTLAQSASGKLKQ